MSNIKTAMTLLTLLMTTIGYAGEETSPEEVASGGQLPVGAVAWATGPGKDESGNETADEKAEAADDSAGGEEQKFASTVQGVRAGCAHMTTRSVGAGCCSFLWSNQKKQKQICVYGTWYNQGSAWCSRNRCGACSAARPC